MNGEIIGDTCCDRYRADGNDYDISANSIGSDTESSASQCVQIEFPRREPAIDFWVLFILLLANAVLWSVALRKFVKAQGAPDGH